MPVLVHGAAFRNQAQQAVEAGRCWAIPKRIAPRRYGRITASP